MKPKEGVIVDEPELIDGKYVVKAYAGTTILRFSSYEDAKHCLDTLNGIKVRQTRKYRFSGYPGGFTLDELPERTRQILDLIEDEG